MLSLELVGIQERFHMRSYFRDLLYWFYYWAHQLFPFTYRSRYSIRGRKHFTVWRMWLGRCFDIDDVIVTRSIHKAR